MLRVNRTCNARTRSGGWCRNPALPNSTRCYRHGAAGGRPRGIPLARKHIIAMVEGRRRWVERMRTAKAAGLIERFPGGRRARGLPPLSKDPKIRKAQRLIETRMAERNAAVVMAPRSDPPAHRAERPWAEMSKGEKLAAATDRALDVAKAYLDVPVDPSNLKLASLQTNLALGVIGYQVRVESGALSGDAIKTREPPRIMVSVVSANGKDEILPRIASQAEYDALPSGQHFIAPDGTERVKP